MPDIFWLAKVFGDVIIIGSGQNPLISSLQDFAQKFHLVGRSAQISERVTPLFTFNFIYKENTWEKFHVTNKKSFDRKLASCYQWFS